MTACAVCSVELFDDPHFDDSTQVPLCDECCPCSLTPGGGEAGDGAPHDRRPRQALGSASPARGAVDGPEGSADPVRATQFSPVTGPITSAPHGTDGQKPVTGESAATEEAAAPAVHGPAA